MQIETYEIEEIKGELGTMAADSEAIEIIERLGLTGQKSLIDTATETRQPFRKITLVEAAVYSTLFPKVTKLEDYNSGTIPLRVLQALEKAKASNLFRGFVIWHPEDTAKDPVLIGKSPSKTDGWSHLEYMDDQFIIARWGVALEPLEKLAVKAEKLWIKTNSAALKLLIEKASSELRMIDALAAKYFTTGERPNLAHRS